MFKVLDEFYVAIARADDTQANRDLAVLYSRLEGVDLDAGGEDGFKVLHGEGPRERFFIEELIEALSLLESASIVRLLHHGLILLTLVGDLRDLAVKGVSTLAS